MPARSGAREITLRARAPSAGAPADAAARDHASDGITLADLAPLSNGAARLSLIPKRHCAAVTTLAGNAGKRARAIDRPATADGSSAHQPHLPFHSSTPPPPGKDLTGKKPLLQRAAGGTPGEEAD